MAKPPRRPKVERAIEAFIDLETNIGFVVQHFRELRAWHTERAKIGHTDDPAWGPLPPHFVELDERNRWMGVEVGKIESAFHQKGFRARCNLFWSVLDVQDRLPKARNCLPSLERDMNRPSTAKGHTWTANARDLFNHIGGLLPVTGPALPGLDDMEFEASLAKDLRTLRTLTDDLKRVDPPADIQVQSLARYVNYTFVSLASLAMHVPPIERDLYSEHLGTLPDFARVELANLKNLAMTAWDRLKRDLNLVRDVADEAFEFIREHRMKPQGWEADANATIKLAEHLVEQAIDRPWGAVSAAKWSDATMKMQTLRDELNALPRIVDLSGHNVGERETNPHELGPADFDLPTIRSAMSDVGYILDKIRKDWIEGDRKQVQLLASGVQPQTSGYEYLMSEVRRPVEDLLHKLNSDLLPFILPHCDPSLRDRLVGLCAQLDPETYAKDRYGDESARWRQTWSASGLDAELSAVVTIVRAKRDTVALEAAKSKMIASVPVPATPSNVGVVRHRDGLARKGQRGTRRDPAPARVAQAGQGDGFGLAQDCR